MLKLEDDIKALQIKLAALEHLILKDDRLRVQYEELVKMEMERYLVEATTCKDLN